MDRHGQLFAGKVGGADCWSMANVPESDGLRRRTEIERSPIEDAVYRTGDRTSVGRHGGEDQQPHPLEFFDNFVRSEPTIGGNHLAKVHAGGIVGVIEQTLQPVDVLRRLIHAVILRRSRRPVNGSNVGRAGWAGAPHRFGRGQTRTMELLPFGRTGHRSTRVIFGAAALGGVRQESADRILAEVLAAGINHIDTAAGYGDSELRLAPWLQTNRSKVFLATKTGQRTGDGARRELEASLTRMEVSSVDLIQLHNLVEPDEWDIAFAPDGVVAALVKAQEEGLVGAIGVTGHGLRIAHTHARSLERFPFASVLFPWNPALAGIEGYAADVRALMDLCRERNVAMQTIKSIARRRWTDETARRFSWYEPLTDEGAIGRAVRFVFSTPDLFVNSSSDARLLSAIVTAANGENATVAPGDDELAADASAFGVLPLFDGADLERI